MVSAAVIARAFVANQQEASRRAALAVEAEENKINNGGITLIDHLRCGKKEVFLFLFSVCNKIW